MESSPTVTCESEKTVRNEPNPWMWRIMSLMFGLVTVASLGVTVYSIFRNAQLEQQNAALVQDSIHVKERLENVTRRLENITVLDERQRQHLMTEFNAARQRDEVLLTACSRRLQQQQQQMPPQHVM